jgi:hypothetical protein
MADYEIRIRVDRSQAQAAVRAQKADHADMEREVRQALRETAQAEKQWARERVAAAKQAAREKAEALKAGEKEILAAAKLANKEISDALKQGLAEAKARAREEQLLARETARARADAAREAARIDNRLLKDSEVATRGQAEAYRRLNEARVKASAEAIAPELRGASVARQLAAAAEGAAASFLSIGAAQRVVGAAVDSLADARDNARGYADALFEAAKASRELQGIVGGKPTYGGAVASAKRRAESGATLEESKELRTQFYNTAQQFIGTKITPEAAERLLGDVEKYAVVKGLPMGAAGELAGSMLQSGSFGADSKGAAAKFRQTVQGASAGRGNYGPLLAGFSQVSPLIGEGQPFKSPQEAMAAVSLAAEFRPDEAGVYARAGARLFYEPGGNKKQEALLKAAGITADTPYLEAVSRFQSTVKAQASQQGLSTNAYLASLKLQEREKGFAQIAVSRGAETIGQRLGVMGKVGDYGAMQAELGAAYADPDQPFGRMRAEGRTRAAELEKGLPLTPLRKAEEEARAQLTKEGYFTKPGAMTGDYLESLGTFGRISPQQIAINRRVRRNYGATGTAESLLDLDPNPIARGAREGFRALTGYGEQDLLRRIAESSEKTARAAEARSATPPAMPKGAGPGGTAVREGGG